MKIQSIRRRQGVTLLEMTIVIMIIIALISVLFIGFKMYRDGANKATCGVALSSAQKEVRAYAALNNLAPGKTFDHNETNLPTTVRLGEKGCPAGGDYSFPGEGAVPAQGVAYMVCNSGTPEGVDGTKIVHNPTAEEVKSW